MGYEGFKNKIEKTTKLEQQHTVFSFFTVNPTTRKKHIQETKKAIDFYQGVINYLRDEIKEPPPHLTV